MAEKFKIEGGIGQEGFGTLLLGNRDQVICDLLKLGERLVEFVGKPFQILVFSSGSYGALQLLMYSRNAWPSCMITFRPSKSKP